MDFKPGMFSATIFDGKKSTSNPVLNDLFSKKAVKKAEPSVKKTVNETEQKKSKKKGGKQETGEALKEIVNSTVENDAKVGGKRKQNDTTSSPTKSKKAKKDSKPEKFPFVHESLLKKSQKQKVKKIHKKKENDDDDDDEPQDKTRTRWKRDKTSDKRTIFVGNCPLSFDKKILRNLFKDYGEIESSRFRCAPTSKLELPKKAVVIKKEFHEKANSLVSFVVFKEEEAAERALEKNGYVVEGHHLRVDLASNQKRHDKRKSIFVGNLPFTVTEDALWSHFADCGTIVNVRVVRDRQTSIGKGIAYIEFESKDGVILAQNLNDVEFEDRKLRVGRCNSRVKQKSTEDNTKQGRKRAQNNPDTFKGKAKDYYSRSNPRPLQRKMSFAPTNQPSGKSFRDLFEAKKERIVNKRKNKTTPRPQKSDGLSAIFGDIPANMKKLKMDNPKLVGKSIKSKEKKDKKKAKEKKKEKKAKKKAG